MNKTKVLYWLPRVLGIIAILFISLFALDSFESSLTFWQQIGAFIMHLVPSFVLLTVLLIAWKWENIGGIVFILIGLGFTPFIFINNYKMNHSLWMSLGIIAMITLPFILTGILFITDHFYSNKE
jgi:hypothetical protein